MQSDGFCEVNSGHEVLHGEGYLLRLLHTTDLPVEDRHNYGREFIRRLRYENAGSATEYAIEILYKHAPKEASVIPEGENNDRLEESHNKGGAKTDHAEK